MKTKRSKRRKLRSNLTKLTSNQMKMMSTSLSRQTRINLKMINKSPN